MKKLVGYLVSLVGLGVMVVGISGIDFGLDFLQGTGKNILLGAGVVLVIVGVMFSMMGGRVGGGSGDVGHLKEEVPIYVGEGKKRKIVGYRRERD